MVVSGPLVLHAKMIHHLFELFLLGRGSDPMSEVQQLQTRKATVLGKCNAQVQLSFSRTSKQLLTKRSSGLTGSWAALMPFPIRKQSRL